MCSPRKWSQKIFRITQVEVDNVFETMHMKNTTFRLATSSSLFSETKWSPLEHKVRTQYSARLNSNGPSPLNGQIQMSVVWGKLVVKFLGERQQKCSKAARLPPHPLPNIDTCITKAWDFDPVECQSFQRWSNYFWRFSETSEDIAQNSEVLKFHNAFGVDWRRTIL